MKYSIKHLSLRLTYMDTVHDRVFPEIWFQPEEICRVVSEWTVEYRTSESVKQLIEKIKLLNEFPLPNKEAITSNETHIYIRTRDEVTFDVEYVTELKPVTLPIHDVIYLFEQYYNWLFQYENCQIPGLIPRNKLDSWLCVPREQVKPEYLAELDAKSKQT
ncbi:MAG: hypothetical protein JNJ57_20015 [Saprospiraceae bacterium]|nr:hypothetical protein [Saprospiraceae bacterium]